MVDDKSAKPHLGVIEGGKTQPRQPQRGGTIRTNETPDRPSQPLTPEEVEELRTGLRNGDVPPKL